MRTAPVATSKGLTLSTARMLWLVFLGLQGIFIAIAHTILKPNAHAAPAPAIVYAIVGLAVVEIAFFATFRSNLLARARAKAESGEAAQAQATWTLAQILGIVSAEAIVLFGFVLHMFGAQPVWISTALLALGVLNMLAYFPQQSGNR